MRRNFSRTLLLLMAFVCSMRLPLIGQSQKTSAPEPKPRQEKPHAVTDKVVFQEKVFDIKYADVTKLAEVLRVFEARIDGNQELRVITVRGRKETVAAVEDAIKRFDVPQPPAKNIELTAYLLVTGEQANQKANIPEELQGVIKQLSSVFSYRGFRLLETMAVLSRDGRSGGVSGVLPLQSENNPNMKYNFGFDSARIVTNENGPIVRVDKLRLNLLGARYTLAGGQTQQDSISGISTDIDIHEGQKVVVGKASIEGGNGALFLVMTAKIVE